VSPILTRPIREQLEHDRVIRQLQARYKRKHEVAINPGTEQNESVSAGDLTVYPDLVLYSQERGRRLEGTVEVETVESVTTLEAQFEWGMFSKLKAPFHLYVPGQALDAARRLCDELHLAVAEIWTYHVGLDQQVRFTQVYRSPQAVKAEAAAVARAAKKAPEPATSAKPARPAPKAKAKAKPKIPAKAAAKKSAPVKAAPKAAKGKAVKAAKAKKAPSAKATRPKPAKKR
jgi:hypothetical protein